MASNRSKPRNGYTAAIIVDHARPMDWGDRNSTHFRKTYRRSPNIGAANVRQSSPNLPELLPETKSFQLIDRAIIFLDNTLSRLFPLLRTRDSFFASGHWRHGHTSVITAVT
jgi:hypothetical protein